MKLKPIESKALSESSRKVTFTISYEDRAGTITKWNEEQLISPNFIEEVCRVLNSRNRKQITLIIREYVKPLHLFNLQL